VPSAARACAMEVRDLLRQIVFLCDDMRCVRLPTRGASCVQLHGPSTASGVPRGPRTCLHTTSSSACGFALALALAVLGCSWRDSTAAARRLGVATQPGRDCRCAGARDGRVADGVRNQRTPSHRHARYYALSIRGSWCVDSRCGYQRVRVSGQLSPTTVCPTRPLASRVGSGCR
jgi:hypothetical protein